MIRNGQTYYYHADGLGSIVAITNATGAVVQRYEYDSFGNITYQQDPNFKQSYTYTGREYDDESGLYYYRARYYDAKVGRFISEDPIGFAGGDVNLYSYVGNNPVNLVDPLGLTSIPWPIVIAPAIPIVISPAGAAVAIGAAILFWPTTLDDPEKCDKGKWMCEGYAQYKIIGANKHVIRGDWITAYGNTEREAALAWKKAAQSSAPKGHTARHIRPRCRKIR